MNDPRPADEFQSEHDSATTGFHQVVVTFKEIEHCTDLRVGYLWHLAL
jgi:hypothetical protein